MNQCQVDDTRRFLLSILTSTAVVLTLGLIFHFKDVRYTPEPLRQGDRVVHKLDHRMHGVVMGVNPEGSLHIAWCDSWGNICENSSHPAILWERE